MPAAEQVFEKYDVQLLGGQQLTFAELEDRVLQPGDAITVSCLAGMGGVGAHVDFVVVCMGCGTGWCAPCRGGVGACRHVGPLILTVIARLNRMRCSRPHLQVNRTCHGRWPAV